MAVILSSLVRDSYNVFLDNFRQSWTANNGNNNQIIVQYETKEFLYRNSDLYLIGVKNSGDGSFREISGNENYNSMTGSGDKITLGTIKTSLTLDHSGGFDSWSGKLRQVILITSEAAKSHTVQYLVGNILDNKMKTMGIKWNDMKCLLTNWDTAKTHRGGNITEPLVYENYRDAGVNLSTVNKYLPV